MPLFHSIIKWLSFCINMSYGNVPIYVIIRLCNFHSLSNNTTFFICEVCNYDLLRLVPRSQWTQSSTVVVSKATKNLNLIYPPVCTSLEVVQIFRWKKYVMLTKPPQLKRRSVQQNSILSQLFVLGIYPFFLS